MKKIFLCFLLAALARNSQATVTAFDYWRMGENNADLFSITNVTGGMALTNIPDPTGVFDPRYDTNVSPAATINTGSFLAVAYTNGCCSRTAPITNLTVNYGVEMWVKPTVTNGTRSLVYNGNSSTTGWGIYLTSGEYMALFGGVRFFAGAPAVPNVWTHVALVNVAGVTTLYVNGVAAGNFGGAAHTVNAVDFFCVAANLAGSETFNGSIDELRVFTFATNQFTTQDLLLGAVKPPPPTPVLYTTFGPNHSYALSEESRFVASSFYVANPFTPGITVPLGAIQVAAYNVIPPNQIRYTVTTDNNGVPGAALETLSATGLGYSNLTRLDSTQFPMLTNGATYWLVASADDTSTESYWWIGPLDGSIPAFTLASTNNGVTWIHQSATDNAFEVDSVFPTINSITQTNANLTLAAGNGIAGQTYLTLRGTNINAPVNTWTPVATNQLSVGGNFTISLTNAIKTNAPQSYFILKIE